MISLMVVFPIPFKPVPRSEPYALFRACRSASRRLHTVGILPSSNRRHNTNGSFRGRRGFMQPDPVYSADRLKPASSKVRNARWVIRSKCSRV